MMERHIGDYHFIANEKSGLTLRWGRTLHDNPERAPVPELADISISNHCSKGCSFCYRNSRVNNEFMSIENYKMVLDALNHPEYGNVFQVALGGGEPLEHPCLRDIIEATCDRSIVPNLTTNGLLLEDKLCQFLSGKIGALAFSISAVKELDRHKLDLALKYGIKANIHYVLSNSNITEVSDLLVGRYNEELRGVNAVVFLTYKPAGRASNGGVIRYCEEFVRFTKLIDTDIKGRPRFGFDACFVPMLLRYTNVKSEMIDSCEGAFFSVYVDHNMNVSPCSFSGARDSYSLREYDFYDIWNNKFECYRQRFRNNCDNDCKMKNLCHGKCPYFHQITICHGWNH